MSEMQPPTPGQHFEPKINHLGITMPRGSLDEEGRREILDFYGEVFGWTHYENPEDKNDPLVLLTTVFGQFVYLMEGDQPMQGDAMDHFGFMVSSEEELDETLERAKRYQEKDDRVRIIDKQESPQPSRYGPATLVNTYIGYKLPLMVELQFIRIEDEAATS